MIKVVTLDGQSLNGHDSTCGMVIDKTGCKQVARQVMQVDPAAECGVTRAKPCSDRVALMDRAISDTAGTGDSDHRRNLLERAWNQLLVDQMLSLVELEREHEAQLRALVADFRAAGEQAVLSDLRQVHGDLDAYLKRLAYLAQGVGLAKGIVPETTLWLVRGGTAFVGLSRLRHRLVPALEHHGGHIGYAICPSERGKGYGTRILALTLDRAREIGLGRVLVTCDTDNIASVRVIERNGGVLEDRQISTRTGKLISRYWIAL